MNSNEYALPDGDTSEIKKPRLRAALKRVRPAMMQLDKKNLATVNLEPLTAVETVRGAMRGLITVRPQLELLAKYFDFDIRCLDGLEDYASALIQTQTVYAGIDSHPADLGELANEAGKLRNFLLRDIERLVERRHIPKSRLKGLTRRNGYRNVASDLMTLVGVLRDSWNRVGRMTPITPAELDRAEELGDQIIGALGRRAKVTEIAADAADDRQRAFTLLVQAYDEVRRGVIFVRWRHGDADLIAPSLYRKRNPRRKSVNEPLSNHPAPNDATIPSSNPPQLQKCVGKEQAPDLTDPKSTNPKPAMPIPIGMPGSDPFIH